MEREKTDHGRKSIYGIKPVISQKDLRLITHRSATGLNNVKSNKEGPQEYVGCSIRKN